MLTKTTDLVAEVLDEYGRITLSAIESYLPRREPQRHLYDLVREYPRRGGRRMRPALCLATARALGSETFFALNTAVAIELMHSSFLVHDDIEDDSEERRGHPTLHEAHGVALALNAGDALGLLAIQPLLRNETTLGPMAGREIMQEAMHMATETVEGQAIELGWRSDVALSLDDEDYLAMVLKKTCWYSTIFPMRAGAIVAERRGLTAERLVRFAFLLGAAFQIQDDLLNLTGDPGRYGKEIGGDLREGKRTLMLIHFLAQADAVEAERAARFLARSRAERSNADVEWLYERLDRGGSIDYARAVTHALAGAAQHEFSIAFASTPGSRDREFLETLPRWVIERS